VRKTGLLLIGALLMAGCGGGGGENRSRQSPIVGRWRLTRVQGLGQTLNCPGTLGIPGVGSASCSDSDLVQFNNDGTFSASGNVSASGEGIELPTGGIPTNGSGTYQFANNTLNVTVAQPVDAQGETGTVNVAFSGQNMTLSATESGVTVTSTFVKVQ